jgi:hypothetical protein
MQDRSLHPNTKVLMDAWQRMQSNPQHHAEEGPHTDDHADLIDSLFVLQRADEGLWTFNTAGQTIKSLVGRELVDHNFLQLWTGPDRAMVEAFVEAIRSDGAPGIMRGRGETMTGQRVEIEITLAPLANRSVTPSKRRVLGLYQTLGGEPFLKGRPIWRHRVTMLAPPVSGMESPHLKLVANNS